MSIRNYRNIISLGILGLLIISSKAGAAEDFLRLEADSTHLAMTGCAVTTLRLSSPDPTRAITVKIAGISGKETGVGLGSLNTLEVPA